MLTKVPITIANRRMMRELIVILAVSLLMMYFILSAQFGSFVQPLIVLLEIPIDTAFALITLWLCGHTLNLMSAIGIIVTCGIVVTKPPNLATLQPFPLSELLYSQGRTPHQKPLAHTRRQCRP